MADTPPIPLLNSSLAETPTLARSRRRSIRRPTWAGSGFRHDIGAAFSPHYHPQLDAIDHLKGITRLKNSSQSSVQGKISMLFIQRNYPGPAGHGANIPPEPADRCSK